MIWELHVITRNRIGPSPALAQLGIVTSFGTSINPTSFFLGVAIDRPTRTSAIQDVVDLLTPVIGRHALERVEGADELMQNRQLLLWVRATRRQLLRWERLVAKSVRAGMQGADRHDADAWDTDIEKHLTLVAANNMLRALENADDRFTPVRTDLARDLRNQRDLHEHWDEQMPAFYNAAQPGPLLRGGSKFAELYPGERPFASLAWNGTDGPVLGPGLVASELHEVLDQVQAEVLATAPSLARFVTAAEPSPWLGLEHGRDRWWPRLED